MHLRMDNTSVVMVDRLQQQRTTSGSTPISQDQDSEAVFVFFQISSEYSGTNLICDYRGLVLLIAYEDKQLYHSLFPDLVLMSQSNTPEWSASLLVESCK